MTTGPSQHRPAIGSVRSRLDVAIVGGGIFGLFAALTLARAGRAVTILDRSDLWGEASGVNAGSLGVQNKLPALVPYSLWSWDIWQDVAQDLGFDAGVRRHGGYKVALTDKEAERLDKVAVEQERLGLTVRRMTRSDISAEVPWLSSEVVAATYSPNEGFASPTLLGPILRQAVESAGVTIAPHSEVIAIRPGRVIEVETADTLYVAEVLAITAGAWSGRVAAMLGVWLPVALDVNMVTVTDPAPPTVGDLVTHARGILTLKQVANGSCLIGGGWQGLGTLDDRRKDIDHDQLVQNLRLAERVIPGLGLLNVLRSWAGYEGVTPDSLPYLGRLAPHRNIYCAACARGGFTLGPLIGRLLGELIETGNTSRPIDIFDPMRFARV